MSYEWEDHSKYKKEFDHSINRTSQMITIPKGNRKRMYNLRWQLAFGKITFDEYERRVRKLKKELKG